MTGFWAQKCIHEMLQGRVAAPASRLAGALKGNPKKGFPPRVSGQTLRAIRTNSSSFPRSLARIETAPSAPRTAFRAKRRPEM